MNPLLTNFVLHVAMLVSILKQVGIFTCTNTPTIHSEIRPTVPST